MSVVRKSNQTKSVRRKKQSKLMFALNCVFCKKKQKKQIAILTELRSERIIEQIREQSFIL